MAVSLHHIVFDAHDLVRLAQFWAEVLDWQILSQREREIVIGADEAAEVGICFMAAARIVWRAIAVTAAALGPLPQTSPITIAQRSSPSGKTS